MPLDAPTLAAFEIVVAGDAPPLAHAAAELRAHLSRFPAATAAGTIVIDAGDAAGDGFTVSVSAGRLVLHGANPRGALNAAYWLLEEVGFLWVEPAERGICYQPRSLPAGEYVQTAAFPRRTLILGGDAYHNDWPDWLAWASRNRYNDLFFHDTPPSVRRDPPRPLPVTREEYLADSAGWMFERWAADGPAIAAAAREHGMTLQFGGHHLPAFIRREAFEDHPEWFPVRKGQRDPRYNLCPTCPDALDELRRGAEVFFARYPGADVYHAWADDIWGGGWCSCESCDGLSPSDQALIATNAVADVLARVQPDARIAHLAYHDTLKPPEKTRPAENVTLLFAPRERCYAHGIADERCAKNHDKYWEPFKGLLDLFGHDPARIQVFEYYSDAILFKGLAPTQLAVLPLDTMAYADAGVSNIQNLMVANRPWIGAPWHAWWTARCLWSPAANLPAELARFCDAAFPENSSVMQTIYRDLDRAYRLFLSLHDLELAPRHDVLDFSARPRRTLSAKAPESLEGALLLQKAARQVAALHAADPRESERLARAALELEGIAAIATHLANRVSAWDAALDGLPGQARTYLDAAKSALTRYEAWDATNNEPAFAPISVRMLAAAHWHTDEVEQLVAGDKSAR